MKWRHRIAVLCAAVAQLTGTASAVAAPPDTTVPDTIAPAAKMVTVAFRLPDPPELYESQTVVMLDAYPWTYTWFESNSVDIEFATASWWLRTAFELRSVTDPDVVFQHRCEAIPECGSISIPAGVYQVTVVDLDHVVDASNTDGWYERIRVNAGMVRHRDGVIVPADSCPNIALLFMCQFELVDDEVLSP